MWRGSPNNTQNCFVRLPLSLFSIRSNLQLMPKGCSSLLSTPVVPSSGRRSPTRFTTPYVWINRRETGVRSLFEGFLHLHGGSSLLSSLVVPSSGRRSPAGSTTPYVLINHREIVRSIFRSRESRLILFTGFLPDLFVGFLPDWIYFMLLQLSLNIFRCIRDALLSNMR